MHSHVAAWAKPADPERLVVIIVVRVKHPVSTAVFAVVGLGQLPQPNGLRYLTMRVVLLGILGPPSFSLLGGMSIPTWGVMRKPLGFVVNLDAAILLTTRRRGALHPDLDRTAMRTHGAFTLKVNIAQPVNPLSHV